MPRYSTEFKDTVVKKMMPPNARSVAAVSEETGVATGTLYNWRTKYRNQGIAVPADDARPDKWTAQDKLAVVIETAALNQHALSEYCREKGLYTAQITEWRNAALHGYEKTEVTMAELKQHRKSDKRQIKRKRQITSILTRSRFTFTA